MKTDKEKIDELIDYERSYSSFQLFITGLFYYHGTFANKRESRYKLWKRSYWSGPFFAVFTVNFDSNGMVTKIDVEKSPTAEREGNEPNAPIYSKSVIYENSIR